MDKHRQEINELKLLYQEIIQGCSYVESVNAYVKHSNEVDNTLIIQKRLQLYKKYVADGIPTEADSLKRILDDGTWTQQDEENILQIRYIISDNEKNMAKIIPQQQEPIKHMIKVKKKELTELLLKKKQLLNLTVEDTVEEDMINFISYVHLYKDVELKERVSKSFDDFEAVDTELAGNYIEATDSVINKFTEPILKKIAVSPFFINPFSYAKDHVGTFLGKPVAYLTYHQMSLFGIGTRNLNILAQSEGEPPELHDDVTMQQIVDWFDAQYSTIMGRRNKTPTRR